MLVECEAMLSYKKLEPGPLELRFVWNIDKDLSDSMATALAGTYDITYKIMVDPALAAPEGEPAPVKLVPELVTVFDGVNAVVNAHDVDKALSYFAGDAVASIPAGAEPLRRQGRAVHLARGRCRQQHPCRDSWGKNQRRHGDRHRHAHGG